MQLELKTALIAVGATLAGALGGGLATYLSQHALNDQVVQNQQEAALRAAVVVARMQSAEYAYADTALHAMITVADYRAQPAFFVSHVTVEDRKLMIAELHDSDFAVLATADLDLALVRERVRERRARQVLTDADKKQFEGTESDLRAAQRALAPLRRRHL